MANVALASDRSWTASVRCPAHVFSFRLYKIWDYLVMRGGLKRIILSTHTKCFEHVYRCCVAREPWAVSTCKRKTAGTICRVRWQPCKICPGKFSFNDHLITRFRAKITTFRAVNLSTWYTFMFSVDFMNKIAQHNVHRWSQRKRAGFVFHSPATRGARYLWKKWSDTSMWDVSTGGNMSFAQFQFRFSGLRKYRTWSKTLESLL